MDPELARDNSPEPRKHSTGENVPDLIAYKDNYLLIIEAKSNYSISDKDKLTDLIENKRAILLTSLASFCQKYNFLTNVNLSNLIIIPTLFTETKDAATKSTSFLIPNSRSFLSCSLKNA